MNATASAATLSAPLERRPHKATRAVVEALGEEAPRALYRAFDAYNEEHFAGALGAPLIFLTQTSGPRALGDYIGRDVHGLRSRVRIAPGVVARGELFALDVLLHEMVHAWASEVACNPEHGYRGHGPVFAAKCNENRREARPPAGRREGSKEATRLRAVAAVRSSRGLLPDGCPVEAAPFRSASCADVGAEGGEGGRLRGGDAFGARRGNLHRRGHEREAASRGRLRGVADRSERGARVNPRACRSYFFFFAAVAGAESPRACASRSKSHRRYPATVTSTSAPVKSRSSFARASTRRPTSSRSSAENRSVKLVSSPAVRLARVTRGP